MMMLFGYTEILVCLWPQLYLFLSSRLSSQSCTDSIGSSKGSHHSSNSSLGDRWAIRDLAIQVVTPSSQLRDRQACEGLAITTAIPVTGTSELFCDSSQNSSSSLGDGELFDVLLSQQWYLLLGQVSFWSSVISALIAVFRDRGSFVGLATTAVIPASGTGELLKV